MASPSSPDSDSLGVSLLAWVRSFEGAEQVQELGELGNGQRLWAILQDIDAGYFTGALPEPEIEATGDWTRKWQNLKHVEKQLAVYYRDVCNGQLPAAGAGASTAPDTQAIAADASIPDLEKLLMQIIRAAMASPASNQRMGKRLLGLGNDHAMAIAYEIRSMEEAELAGPSEPASRDESAYQSEQEVLPERPSANGLAENGGLFGDPLLEREEELLQAQATIEKLQASHATAQRQLQELRQDKEQLQEAFDAYRSEINTKGRKATGDDAFKKLQRQAESDRAYIENLENEIQSSRNTIDNFERQLQRFKSEEEGSQKLRDDLQMLRTENEDLSQKVKANENLKKKIQALQEQEKLNATLRDEIKQANDKLEELDRLKQFQASLEKEIVEKKGLIRNQEYQINELVTTRKHAEYDSRVLAQRLEAARERQDRDHEAIEELRAKLREQNADDTVELAVPEESTKKEPEVKAPVLKNDESKNLRERLALVEQQLEASDARLKQASQRNAALEEENRTNSGTSAAQQKAEQQLEEQQHLIAELRKQVELAAKLPKEASQPQDIAALQRENRLMATAWYDLSTRLQQNGVSVGRRRQEPKSWIGKQRALVGPNSGLVAHR